MECPYCHREIDNSFIRSAAAKQLGSVKSHRKKKGSEEMSRLGKLGAKKRWGKTKARQANSRASLSFHLVWRDSYAIVAYNRYGTMKKQIFRLGNPDAGVEIELARRRAMHHVHDAAGILTEAMHLR